MNEWMNEYDLSDAITETVAAALNVHERQHAVRVRDANFRDIVS